MGKKKGKKPKEPEKRKETYTFKPPPEGLNDHFSLHAGVRMEGVVDQSRLTMRPVVYEKKPKLEDRNGKDATSDYKKKKFKKATLGWYYYLPKWARPKPKLAQVAAAADDDQDLPAGATKKRNKMLLCEAAAEGDWDGMVTLLDVVQGLDVNEPDEEGDTVLCAAASNGHAKVILQLFNEYRVDLLLARKGDGYTALMCACERGEAAAVDALLQCAHVLPVRVALQHLRHEDLGHLNARAHAVKRGSNAIVRALDEAEKRTLGRPAACRHKCGVPITFGEQEAHEAETCPKFTCECANGCGARLRRSYMELHQGSECPMRIRVPSPR